MSEINFDGVRGLAFLCDSDGRIEEILYDQIGLSDHIAPGKSLSAVVDEASSDKSDLFLESLHQHGLALNWELNVPVHQPPMPLLFAGIVLGDRRLILGAASYQNILQLFEELSKINSEQVNAFRDAMKQLTLQDRPQQGSPPNSFDSIEHLYNELSALNNQLTNTQRALAKVNAELRIQRDRFHTTLASIGDAVIATDIRGMITFMNPVAEAMLGLDNLEIKGELFPDQLLIVDPATNEPIENPLKIAKQETRFVEMLDKVLVRPEGGAEVPIDLNCAPIRSEGDDIIGFVLILRDITASKLSAEKELQLIAEKERVQILADFIRDASHDLRTSITIMMTSLHLLGRIPDPEKQQQQIEKLRNQMGQLHEYIETLIIMTQLDAITELKLASTSLNTLVETVLVKSQPMAAAKNLMLIRELDSQLPQIYSNAQYFDYAAMNIVKNAIFFTPEGGQITVRTFSEDDRVCLEVIDTGIGIEEDQQDRIFERFYRIDSSRSRETGGSGLGLALAKRIVTLHRGTIEVDSTPGKGSTFRIYLPPHLPEDQVS